MWTVFYGGEPIGDPREGGLPMVGKELEVALNKTGTFRFELPMANPFCGKLALHGKESEVTVHQDGEEIFRGRVMSSEEHFDGSVEYECEGDRGYLNDALLQPFKTGEGGVPGTVDGYFAWLVARYNDSQPGPCRFTVGINQGHELDPSNAIEREASNRPTVWSEMKSAIVDGLGGYVRTRMERGTRYIDLLASGDVTATQRIRFGENLLDFTRRSGVEGYCTRVYAVGGTPEGADSPITLEGLGRRALLEGYELVDGWVVDHPSELEHGVIEGSFEDSSATEAESLLASAQRHLVNVKVGDAIEMTALDLHNVDPSVRPIRIGDYVRATSKPHGFDEWFICTSRKYDLDSPENDAFTLGSEYDTLTGAQSKKLAELNSQVDSTVESVGAATALAGSKSAIFSSQPAVYKANDLWVKAPTDGHGDVNILVATRDSDEFSASDWERASDYTNDETAEAALGTAQTAQTAATQAQADAASASASATRANTSANSALAQLGTVEDVLGTVSWIAEHGTYSPTADAQVDDSKVYYERSGSGTTSDPYVYTAVAEPTASGLPSYYELTVDQALSRFVASHLALTDAGLYVLKDGNGYKALLSNTGMSVVDPSGKTVATYGEGISFDSERPLRIGNSTAYIEYYDTDDDGIADSIRIVGSNLNADVANFEQTVSETYTTKTEFNNLEIGGRNLLRFTTSPIYAGNSNAENLAKGWCRWNGNATVERTSDGIKCTCTSDSSLTGFCIPFIEDNAVIGGVEYVLSFDYKTNTTTIGSPYLLKRSGGNTPAGAISITASTDSWSHFSEVIKWPSTGDYVTYALLVPYISGQGNYLEIKDGSMKLERGNRATDWSPASEDMASASDSVEYITGTQTAVTGAWTGVTKDATLEDGKTIVYKLPYNGSGNATLNLTLAGGGTTGAKGVYHMYSTGSNTSSIKQVNTHYPAGSAMLMSYDSTNNRWLVSNYNTNVDTVNRTKYQAVLTAAEAITNTHIICGTSAGYQNIAAGVTFDLAYPLLYAATKIAKGATSGTRDNNFVQINDISFSANGTITGGAAGKMLYLKGVVSGNSFTIADSPFMTTVPPDSDDGLAYIPLGVMTSATVGYFESSRQVHAFFGGAFQPVGTGAKSMTVSHETRITQTEADVTTAITKVNGLSTLVRQYDDGVLVCRTGNTVGALVNADGSFDVVGVTWSGSTPTAGSTIASFGQNGTSFLGGKAKLDVRSDGSMILSDSSYSAGIGLYQNWEDGAGNTYTGVMLYGNLMAWGYAESIQTASALGIIRAANAVPTVLYNNTSGTTGTVTLSQSAANFNHMRVYATSPYGDTSCDIINPNSKDFTLLTSATDNTSTTTLYMLQQRRTISGTSITVRDNGYSWLVTDIGSNRISGVSAAVYIAITRVEAWNE